MYNQFTLVGMNFDARRGEIEIQFSLAIEPTTANLNTLFLFDEETKDAIAFDIRVEQKSVFLVPADVTPRMILNVREGLLSITGDKLPRRYNHRIKSDTKTGDKPTIKYPADFETLYQPRIAIQPGKETNADYEVQVSKDTAFHTRAFEVVLQERNEISFRLAEYGQYYARVRSVVEDKKSMWSDAVSFTYEAEARTETEDFEGPVIATDLVCTQKPESGVTPASFIFTFDEELSEDIGRITVKRRLV